MHFLKIRVLLKRIKAIRFMMKDKSVAWWKKGLIIFGIVYLFLPIDIIPPFIPVLGVLDDLFLWIFILWYLSSELDKYWYGDKPNDLSKKYGGKKVIDDVEYEVDDKAD
ncbi:MAG: DUF1232 domain-containing protein [Firmicutes bacterium]|nr:DUF1232 domain-containing protein [Bacillota bacterium]